MSKAVRILECAIGPDIFNLGQHQLKNKMYALPDLAAAQDLSFPISDGQKAVTEEIVIQVLVTTKQANVDPIVPVSFLKVFGLGIESAISSDAVLAWDVTTIEDQGSGALLLQFKSTVSILLEGKVTITPSLQQSNVYDVSVISGYVQILTINPTPPRICQS